MYEVVVEFTPAVCIDVRVPGAPTKPHDVLDAFRTWRLTNHVFSLPGTLGGGPGWHHGAYTQEDATQITRWFRGQGIEPVDTTAGGA